LKKPKILVLSPSKRFYAKNMTRSKNVNFNTLGIETAFIVCYYTCRDKLHA